MNEERKHLKIVPYSPNDYSLGDALTREDGAIIEDERLISAALSLYFQWPEHRTARVYQGLAGQSESVPCEISYDTDERSPSELRISVGGKARLGRELEYQRISIRFEVFRVCYEFEVTVLAVSGNPAEDGWDMIVTVPGAITVFKNRKLPRYDLSGLAEAERPRWKWESVSGSEHLELSIVEIGMKSVAGLCVEAITEPKEKKGYILADGLRIPAEYVRANQKKLIFVFAFESGKQTGEFFDVYRKFAYPELRSRHEYPYEVGVDLYYKTGYFSKFSAEKDEEQKKALMETWAGIKSGTHETTADYYVVDENDEPTGCSSVVAAFMYQDKIAWAFHQLCALKRPNLLESSGILYSWRAEYLFSRPEQPNALMWFDGKSRWLDRIYVKFALQAKYGSKIFPSSAKKIKIENTKPRELRHFKEVKIGLLSRYIGSENHLYVGLAPKLLNAGTNLNNVFTLEEGKNPIELIKYAQACLNETSLDEIELKVSLTGNPDLTTITGLAQDNERTVYLANRDLDSFQASVEHSVAVTAKKHSEEYAV